MKIIIIGAGSIGFQLAKKLIVEKKDVVLIEKDAKKAKNADSLLDCIVLQKDGSQPSTLKGLELNEDDILISVTESDEVNIIACNLASLEFNVQTTIAKIISPDYVRSKLFQNNCWNINFTVNPAVEAAKNITTTVIHGALSDIILFNHHKIQMRNIVVDPKSFFKDRTVKNIKAKLHEEFLIAAIFRQNKFVIPAGDFQVLENDIISLIATKSIFDNILSKIGKPKHKISKIVIVGGSKIAPYIINYLLRTDREIKIIEKDYDVCKKLAHEFPKALVINSDILNENIFEEEQLDTYDLMITLTSDQELNILSAIYAKSQGIKRAIALARNPKYLSVATTLGIDAVINPKTSAVNKIMTFLRSKNNVKNIYSLFNDQAEVIEFKVSKSNRIVNKPIKKIKMPKDSLIIAVIRENKNYVPDGEFIINPSDTIIVITKKESCPQVDQLFMTK